MWESSLYLLDRISAKMKLRPQLDATPFMEVQLAATIQSPACRKKFRKSLVSVANDWENPFYE
jgi:hypothetical protein